MSVPKCHGVGWGIYTGENHRHTCDGKTRGARRAGDAAAPTRGSTQQKRERGGGGGPVAGGGPRDELGAP